MSIKTKRLLLMPLTPEQLTSYLYEPQVLEQGLGFPVSHSLVNDVVRRAIHVKLNKMQNLQPGELEWLTYWLVIVRQPPMGAGLIGFKGLPDMHGSVEIGYGIDPVYRNRGLITEAVKSLLAWAFQHENCQVVIADTSKENLASRRVLEKAGLQRYLDAGDILSWKIEKKTWVQRHAQT
jgi:ribosomal-protein-alanine N-acetyltransferase